MSTQPSNTDVIQVWQKLPQQASANELEIACQSAYSFVTDKQRAVHGSTYTHLCRLLLDKVPLWLTWSRSQTTLTTSKSLQHQYNITRFFDDCFLKGNPVIAFAELTSVLTSDLSSKESRASAVIVARTLVLFVNASNGGAQRLAQIISHVGNSDAGSNSEADIVNNLIHLPSRLLNVLYSHFKSNGQDQELDLMTGSCDIDENRDQGDNTIGETNWASGDFPITENDYMETLCEALHMQTSTLDVVRNHIEGALLSRIITLGYAHAIVSVIIRHKDTKKAQLLLTRVAPSRIQQIGFALLDADVNFAGDSDRFVRNTVIDLVQRNRAVRDAFMYRIPFSRPLFRHPRRSLLRLVKAISSAQKYDDVNANQDLCVALITAAENWSDESFTLGADITIQRQVTRLLLYYLRQGYSLGLSTENLSLSTSIQSIPLIIGRGVQIRLDESDVRLRRHAMVVAEAASRFARDKNPLTFDRAEMVNNRRNIQRIIGDDPTGDGADSDFSDLARSVGQDRSCSEENRDILYDTFNCTDKTGGSAFEEETICKDFPRSNSDNCGKNKTNTKLNCIVRCNWPQSKLEDNWQQDDDWSSTESYELTSSDDEGRYESMDVVEEALRKKLNAPDSVARFLELLREMNSSDGGAITVPSETALAALRSIATRADARRRVNALRTAALDLCLDISTFDSERYPDDVVTMLKTAREEALIAVIRLDIGLTGAGMITGIVCGPSADIGRRLETLTVLTNAVQKESRFVEMQVEKVERGLRRKTQILAEQFMLVFRTLADMLCTERAGNADFINMEQRDCELWARALVLFGALAHGAGATTEGIAMRRGLLSITLDRVSVSVRADVVVRRAMAVVFGSVVDGMTDGEISQALQGAANDVILSVQDLSTNDSNLEQLADRALEWLALAAESDADVGVRRFARLGLQRWAARANT